tara:strand:- start:733 stop:2316 length:1584 start_codon:yes stop_codon:yes gene_type:complete
LASSENRWWWIASITIVTCSLVGGIWGPRTGLAAASEQDEIRNNLRRFSKILSLIEDQYAGEFDPEKAVFNGAIPVMLQRLDPHSQFFSPEAFKQLRDDQKGQYAGVGMQIQHRNGRTVVMFPFPKTPAYRVGLRPGDIIAEVNGETTEGLNTTEVAKRLRGPAGTTVRIGIERRGIEDLIEVEVTRARIPRRSVPVSFFLKPRVGFIRIDTFNEKTGQELDSALEKLGEGKLEGLILDLRGNRGGLLSQGVYVSGKFIERGQTVVSHHGRSSTERVYKAQTGNGNVLYPMVVMVNCDSASASEIVAGALQDHDRALIIGTNTFGKGLVQTVYPMSQSSGLALTTARYYTPSGRLIQRRYDNLSLYSYYASPCSQQYEPATDQVRLTDKGRTVYGGGGITPDFKLEDQKFNDFQTKLRRNYAFTNFAQEYTLARPNLAPGWEPDENTIAIFQKFLEKEKIVFATTDLIENESFIKRFVKREIYVSAYDLDEGNKVYYRLDPDVQKALGILPAARSLLEDGERVVAKR